MFSIEYTKNRKVEQSMLNLVTNRGIKHTTGTVNTKPCDRGIKHTK
jgi:hypothetical protein